MANKKQSRGKCSYCGHEAIKGSMTKHLSLCSKRQEAIAKTESKNSGKEKLFHLRVYDPYLRDFWLDLEMRGSATLKDLDYYLREIWLECCDHLSQFGNWGEEIAMSRKVENVFSPGFETIHLYDFGTTSETMIRCVGVREGVPTTKYPIALMSRNNMPAVQCIKCDEEAAWLCTECIYEHESPGTLCDTHAKKHLHKDYGEPFPLVNSPRVGMCGYEGPADPPY
jgi:hypothetical protein